MCSIRKVRSSTLLTGARRVPRLRLNEVGYLGEGSHNAGSAETPCMRPNNSFEPKPLRGSA
jgi:hypothetical protein